MSSIAAIASDMLTHSCTSSELRTSATSILGIAPDEKLGVLARRRGDAAAHESLAQNAHLSVVDARQRLADRPAVEAVQPVLVLPQLPVNQAGAAHEARRDLGARLARGVQPPVDLHRLVEFSL